MLKLRNTLIIILTLTIITLVKGQTNQKDSSYYKEFKPLIGYWNLAPISNVTFFLNKRSAITIFIYQNNKQNANNKPTIEWGWGEEFEDENGNHNRRNVVCQFDTSAIFYSVPIDSLLNKFTYLKVIDDALCIEGINEIGEEYLRKLENINNLRYIKTYSDNCFKMEIFLVYCIEKKLLYIFSKYGLDILEKIEH